MLSFSAVSMGFAILTSVSAVPTPMTEAAVGAMVAADGQGVGAKTDVSANILDGLISTDTHGALGLFGSKVATRSLLDLSDSTSLGLGHILDSSTGVAVSAGDDLDANVSVGEHLSLRDVDANIGADVDLDAEPEVEACIDSLLGADIDAETGVHADIGADVDAHAFAGRNIDVGVDVDAEHDLEASVDSLVGADIDAETGVHAGVGVNTGVHVDARSHADEEDENDGHKDTEASGVQKSKVAEKSPVDITEGVIAKLTNGKGGSSNLGSGLLSA